MIYKTMGKKLTDRDKIDFIVKTEMEIITAVRSGHKCSDGDQFEPSRKLMKKYRIELGIIKKEKE